MRSQRRVGARYPNGWSTEEINEIERKAIDLTYFNAMMMITVHHDFNYFVAQTWLLKLSEENPKSLLAASIRCTFN